MTKTEQFVADAKEVHGDLYCYLNAQYTTCKAKIQVTCKIHGDWGVTKSNHVSRKSGCPSCAKKNYGIDKKIKARESFITDCKTTHAGFYDYSRTIYVKAHDKVTITCPLHGDFLILAYMHRQGQGCKACGIARRAKNSIHTQEHFIAKAKHVHGDKYDYSKTVYTKAKNKITIICPHHGEFTQVANSHLSYGCKKCGEVSWVAEYGYYSTYFFHHKPDWRYKTALLYVVRIFDSSESFYKVGITKDTIDYRYHSNLNGYNFELIESIQMPLYFAYLAEQDILTACAANRYEPTRKFGGYSECLTSKPDIRSYSATQWVQ